MISVSGLAKSFGNQTLFENASFQLNPGESYGLVGANGSGKTTLLKILAGDELPSDGTVSVPKRLRVGVLRQDQFLYEDEAILQVVLMGNAELWEAMAEKEKILARAEETFDADRYAELEDIILRNDGYAVESRAAEILEGLGIPAEVHHNPLSTLSGGFRLRVLLAQVLAAYPDALLLDEPTNHLDIISIRWLEKFLQDFPGIVVVISHDHRFLDNVCNRILDVDYETVTLYSGNYSYFDVEKVDARERMEKEQSKREKEIAHHKAFIERFRAKATKARQAQSKVRLIEKKAEGLKPIPQTSRRYPTFRFHQTRPSGREVLKLERISKAYGDNQVLENVSLTVRRGERLAVIGPNGIGKSTLLKIAMGVLEPDAGKVEWGYETHPGYFAQDHKEEIEGQRQTVEANLWEVIPGEPIGSVRGQLALVLFSGDDVEKRLGSLSGGEAARLVFARLSALQPNVLILDEPTNHLDLEAIEALVEGLRQYEGTMLLVSHDRWFVSQLADRILEITEQGPRVFDGSYDEYVQRCGDDHLDAEQVLLKVRREKKDKKSKSEAATETASDRRERKKLESRRDELEKKIEKTEARIDAINETFSDPAYFEKAARDEVSKLDREQKTLAGRIEELMAEWEGVEEEIAGLD